jgi:hypothetical protein
VIENSATHKTKNARRILLQRATMAAASALLLASALSAQNSRGSLRGTVQDATGARIPAARIVVQMVAGSARREASSEDRGEFRLDDLLPGP